MVVGFSGLAPNQWPCRQVGDHIEKIDGVSLVGHRHYEVAKMLKDIDVGKPFILRVVEPLKAGFGMCPWLVHNIVYRAGLFCFFFILLFPP